MSLDIDRKAPVQQLAMGARNARIFNDSVRPYWSADSARFSYQRQTPQGVEYLLVEPAARTRGPLFDASALLNNLAAATGQDVAGLDALEQVALAPDGEGVIFIHGDRRWRASLERFEVTELGPAPGPAEVMSPDGAARVLVADHNLWLLDRDGARRRLTTDGEDDYGYDFIGFTLMVSAGPLNLSPVIVWSPDSRRLAAIRADLRQVARMPLVQAAPPEGARPKLHTFPFPTPGDEHAAKLELVFLDREGNSVRAKIDGMESFSFNPLAIGQGWWEADSRHFIMLDKSRDGHRVHVWRIDAETGQAERLVTETAPGVGRPNLANRPIAHRLADGRVIFGSDAGGWAHLYMVDPGARESRRPITSGDWRVFDLIRVDEAPERILFTAGDREPGVNPYYPQLYSIGFDGTGLRRLTPEGLGHDLTLPLRGGSLLKAPSIDYGPGADGVSPDGRWFVDSFGAVDQPSVSVLRDADGALVMELETADGSQSWPSDLPLPEPFKVMATDGVTELWGVLYRPAGFSPEGRYPVVEVVYGGPQAVATPRTFRQSAFASTAEQLAALSYVAVIIDGPGTPQRSRDFWFKSYGRIESCGGLDEHVAAIKTLAGERPWMDLASGVGITGQSGGGYATVRAMATFPDFYTVGVSICGNHDQAGYVSGWGDVFHGLYEPDLYKSQANETVADQITGKLFLIHGDMDDNVPPALTLQVADALIKADVDFDLLIVPNVTHGVAQHPYALRRTHDFFLRHLPPPPPSTPGTPLKPQT